MAQRANKLNPLELIKREWQHDALPDFTPQHLQELNKLDVLDNSEDEGAEEDSQKQAKPLTDHELKLLPAIQLGRKGRKYCLDADSNGAQPPRTHAWRVKAVGDRRGPAGEITVTASSAKGPYYLTYGAAYRNPRMRPLIYDERYRVCKKAIARGLIKSSATRKNTWLAEPA